MKSKPFVAISAALILVLLVSVSVLAMSSASFKLDWFVQPPGNGGGQSSSSSYAANFTIGQTVVGPATSTNYKAGLGYWAGAGGEYTVFLPAVKK